MPSFSFCFFLFLTFLCLLSSTNVRCSKVQMKSRRVMMASRGSAISRWPNLRSDRDCRGSISACSCPNTLNSSSERHRTLLWFCVIHSLFLGRFSIMWSSWRFVKHLFSPRSSFTDLVSSRSVDCNLLRQFFFRGGGYYRETMNLLFSVSRSHFSPLQLFAILLSSCPLLQIHSIVVTCVIARTL